MKEKDLKFIEKAQKVHGDKYDYSKVEYIKNSIKVCVICPKHGEFWVTPNNHLRKRGCPKCGKEKTKDKLTKTTETFIAEAKKVHGDKYDYSKVEYYGAHIKICIICPKHGEFWQTPHSHLNGNGCSKCNNEKTSKRQIIPYNVVVEKFKKIHGNKYIYLTEEESGYVDATTKIKIICPKHGEFFITPNSHLSGTGCNWCSKRHHYSTEEFIAEAKKVHGDKYDYSKVEYKRAKDNICIICPIHGEFWQKPSTHLRGNGCNQCGIETAREKQKMGKEEFIKRAREIHGDKYDYSKVEYIDSKTEVCIICPKHGEFWQKPTKHNCHQGCPKCNASHLEKEIEALLKENNIIYETQQIFDWLKYQNKLHLDFFIPSKKIAIECQGMQHFKSVDYFDGKNGFKLTKKRDEIKRKLCEEHGIKILYYSNLGIVYPYHVYEDKKELIKKLLE